MGVTTGQTYAAISVSDDEDKDAHTEARGGWGRGLPAACARASPPAACARPAPCGTQLTPLPAPSLPQLTVYSSWECGPEAGSYKAIYKTISLEADGCGGAAAAPGRPRRRGCGVVHVPTPTSAPLTPLPPPLPPHRACCSAILDVAEKCEYGTFDAKTGENKWAAKEGECPTETDSTNKVVQRLTEEANSC